ncbi:MAG TPA: hypothetical protein VMT22_11905 [Terriglobales bacterium]|nr:hypothetical protein [Terriglobales bacterium]
MRIWRALSVFLLSFLVAACATTGSRYDGGRGWELLGQREADLRVEHDRIEVGRREGSFREIRLAVRGAPVEIYNVVVTFGDGKTFSPNLRLRFDENSASRDIDLPGDRRFIRSVDLAYRSLSRREGRAAVMLYGR